MALGRGGDAIKAMVFFAIFGGAGGLGLCIWVLEDTLLFPGDTMLVGALVFGTLGFFMGDRLYEVITEYWHWWRWF